MPTSGDTYTPTWIVAGADATTEVTVSMLAGDDTSAVYAARAADPGDPQTFTADPITLTAGELRMLWRVTAGPAQVSTARQSLVVDADPNTAPAGFSFATTADLADYAAGNGLPLPDNPRRLLIDASREVERLTRAAVYTIAADGRPADPGIRRAMIDATCELIAWWDETGTATGARAMFTSASIAGASVGFGGQGAANPQADRVGPRVWSILMNAGLIVPGAVQTYG